MKKKFLYILTHPLTLTIIFGFLIIFFLPPLFKKYIVKQVEYVKMFKTTTNSYFDFNNDGVSEEVNMYDTPQMPTVIIRQNRKMIAQWDLQGEFANGQFYFYSDYDGKGNSELYLITINHDSVFINGIDPFKNPGKFFFKKHVDKYKTSVIGNDCSVNFVEATDLNGDEYKELVFSITTGNSASPRKLYAVDIKNNTIITSPESCNTLICPYGYDVNDDGFDEFMAESYGFKNCPDSARFNDHSTWLMVFNRQLNFLFNPIKSGLYMSQLKVRPLKTGRKIFLVVLNMYAGTKNIRNKLQLYSSSGKLLKEKELSEQKNIEDSFLENREQKDFNKVYLIKMNGEIAEIDSDLNMRPVIMLDGIGALRPFQLDLDQDGLNEYIFFSKNRQSLIITRNDFHDPSIIEIGNSDVASGIYLSVINKGNESSRLFFQNGENNYIFDYFRNPMYILKFPVYAGILIILYVIIFVIHKTQEIRVKRKYDAEKRIGELQLKSIRGQTDPHFTLNLIDSIGALFYRQDKEQAGYIFGKYAKLLRTTILGSENIDSSLENEIDYVKNYLDLEKFRFSNKFDYSVTIEEGIDLQIPVPKMLIHTFIENAVKHGVKHLEGKGIIGIVLGLENKYYVIRIQDNGVGRQKAAGYSGFSTGKGLKILDEILTLYMDLKKVKITYEISDLTINGTPAGTVAIIKIPMDKI
ncbi:hypothetical protein D4R20_02010 [bacterium]|nr:MAG: hypothetical protein D4R20_02010 [bacterium]